MLAVLYGHSKKRLKPSLRKYFFTNRIVNVWNSLPLPDTVVTSETVNQFKNRLDKFWSNQELIYNKKYVLWNAVSVPLLHFTQDCL